jgi:CheY-like chemotaxis protein/Flp pilus assembly protein TadD
MATETKFQDRSAKVLLIDSSGAVRQLLSEVAKSVGFSQAQAVATISDAHNILETEGADWLIVPLAADQPINGLHTVRMITSFSDLKNTRVSLLLDQNEMWCLPRAFEFGLLSYHAKPFTKDSLSKELEELMSIFEASEWNSTKLAATYLRKHLSSTQSATDLMQLEQTLMEMFPGNSSQLINLAHAQHMAGKKDAAKVTLKQASFIDASLAPKIDAKAQELFGSTDLTPEKRDGADGTPNALGLDLVVLIDSDDAVRSSVKSVFQELGVTNIKDFSDGESAIAEIESGPEPSLVVMEWRVPKLTGPLLMQRIRSKGFINCPIVILSALIKPTDMPIIREMGVANISQKPMEREPFLRTIIWTIQQERMPTEQQTLENKIRSCLQIKNLTEAEVLAARYLADESIAPGRKNVIRAEIAYAKELYEAARDFAIESLKGTTESIFALNILGKSLMILRQYEQALKCFQKAQSLSPMNLERLVMIAETQAEVGDTAAAKETIADAKDIDPNSMIVAEGGAKVAIASGDPEAAKKILSKIEGVGNVISYLNNKAVAHAKCGHTTEGVELYQKTLDSIPDSKTDIRAIVTYNMALAKIKNNDLPGALIDLAEVMAFPEAKVAKKAASLKKRLDSAISTNSSIALREADHQPSVVVPTNPESPTADDSQAADASSITSTAVQTVAGDLCCYMVYKTSISDTAEYKKLTATPPRFKLRKAIERGETFAGADANASKKAS